MTATVTIPGTNDWCLAADTVITPRCMTAGRLDWDEKWRAFVAGLDILFPSVIDVGAYIGDTARIFLDRGWGVTAFEPYADAFSCLVHNCREAACHMRAVGGGEAYGLDGWRHTNGEKMEGRMNGGGRGVSASASGVSSIRLDDLEWDNVGLLKMDVEGYEGLVLDGARATIRKHRPIIVIELIDAGLRKRSGRGEDDVRGQLREMQYTVEPMWGDNYVCMDWGR